MCNLAVVNRLKSTCIKDGLYKIRDGWYLLDDRHCEDGFAAIGLLRPVADSEPQLSWQPPG